jgi:hypothetical protein
MYSFGARTNLAIIVLGICKLVLGLFFAGGMLQVCMYVLYACIVCVYATIVLGMRKLVLEFFFAGCMLQVCMYVLYPSIVCACIYHYSFGHAQTCLGVFLCWLHVAGMYVYCMHVSYVCMYACIVLCVCMYILYACIYACMHVYVPL